MSRSRIAVFEGWGFSPREMPRGMGRRMGFSPREMPKGMGFSPREMPKGMGAPLFNNPRLQRYGRRSYTVDPLYSRSSYGPVTSSGRRAKTLKRKGYKVKKGRNSPWQVKFKKAAKKCARIARGRNARKGTYQTCMRKALKKAKRSRR